MIKKYQPFLEQIEIKRTLTYEKAFDDFCRILKNCQDFYMDKGIVQFDNSYSYSAKFHRGPELDPDDDYKLIVKYLDDNGWSMSNVEKLVKWPDFYQKIYRQNPTECAPMDYFLYKITNRKFPLQGYEWDTKSPNWKEGMGWEMGNGPEDDELLIRFRYGWHKTKYGRICIEQNMGNISKFISEAISASIRFILKKILDTHQIGDTDDDLGTIEMLDDIKDCFIIEDTDVYIDNEELRDIINELSENHWDSQSDFDKYVANISKAMGFEARIITTGDIKIKF